MTWPSSRTRNTGWTPSPTLMLGSDAAMTSLLGLAGNKHSNSPSHFIVAGRLVAKEDDVAGHAVRSLQEVFAIAKPSVR